MCIRDRCATDTLALGASKYLQEQRIDTLQLASVGNTPLMKFLHPEIVTVDPGYAEAGRQAACQLIAQVTGRSEPQQIIIPANLSLSLIHISPRRRLLCG